MKGKEFKAAVIRELKKIPDGIEVVAYDTPREGLYSAKGLQVYKPVLNKKDKKFIAVECYCTLNGKETTNPTMGFDIL